MKFLKSALISLLFILFILAKSSFAANYKADYTVQYIPQNHKTTDVKIHVVISNLRADLFIREFSLTFPEQSDLLNVNVENDNELRPAEIKQSQAGTVIKTSFKEPETVKNAQNNLYISFSQKNIFIDKGGSWEVTIPTLSQSETSIYNVELFLPSNLKKLSISKPNPTNIADDKIVWNNVKAQTIYAVFGDSQVYKLNLIYHLANDSLSRSRVDIALPPETLYQSIYVESLSPKPESFYTDEDGNYMATYVLSPRQSLSPVFKGYATLYAKPQESMLPFVQESIQFQKTYLQKQQKYWEVATIAPQLPDTVSTISDVFNYVLDKLSYDRGRISKDIVRFGAAKALAKPKNAVCMEYTDLFVTAGRAKKEYVREIEGYGYSQDERLRPQSLRTDVLHSWAEYYDINRKLWIPVDPTWQDTSGIDYFNSLDLNHVVFAIHGKDSVYPLAAGMYKFADTRDITVEPVATKPSDNPDISIKGSFSKKIIDGRDYKTTLSITNTSPVFVKNAQLEVNANTISFKPNKHSITLLAPGETKQITLTYRAPSGIRGKSDSIVVSLDNKPILRQSTAIISLQNSVAQTIIGVSVGLIAFSAILLFFKFILPRLRHDNQGKR